MLTNLISPAFCWLPEASLELLASMMNLPSAETLSAKVQLTNSPRATAMLLAAEAPRSIDRLAANSELVA